MKVTAANDAQKPIKVMFNGLDITRLCSMANDNEGIAEIVIPTRDFTLKSSNDDAIRLELFGHVEIKADK